MKRNLYFYKVESPKLTSEGIRFICYCQARSKKQVARGIRKSAEFDYAMRCYGSSHDVPLKITRVGLNGKAR